MLNISKVIKRAKQNISCAISALVYLAEGFPPPEISFLSWKDAVHQETVPSMAWSCGKTNLGEAKLVSLPSAKC